MINYDPLSHDTHDNPYPLYRQLRDEAPLYRVEPHGFWLVSRYDDCAALLRDFKTFHSSEGTSPDPYSGEVPPILSSMDPPQHTQVRRLVSAMFTPARIAYLENEVRELARELLAPFAARGCIDIVADFSAYLPMAIISRMLKIPREDQDKVRLWADACVVRDDSVAGMTAAGEEATRNLGSYFNELANARSEHLLGDDLLSAILLAEKGGQLDRPMVLGFLYLLAIAGNETTTKLIGNMTYQLGQHPEQWQLLAENRALIGAAVEETLRFDGSTQMTARVATRDVEWHGQTIKRGERVGALLVSGNRDERHYRDSETYDVRRNPRDHLGFGYGIHACLGAALARLEVRIAFEEIVNMIDNYTLVESGIARMHSPQVRGYTHMPIEFARRVPFA